MKNRIQPITRKLLWESANKYAKENEISDLSRKYSLEGILRDFIFFTNTQRKTRSNK